MHQAPPDVIQTEGQVVQQLQVTMGETSTVVPTEMPRMPRASGTGATGGGGQQPAREGEGIVAAARRLSGLGGPRESTAGGRGSLAGSPVPPSLGGASQGRSSLAGSPVPPPATQEEPTAASEGGAAAAAAAATTWQPVSPVDAGESEGAPAAEAADGADDGEALPEPPPQLAGVPGSGEASEAAAAQPVAHDVASDWPQDAEQGSQETASRGGDGNDQAAASPHGAAAQTPFSAMALAAAATADADAHGEAADLAVALSLAPKELGGEAPPPPPPPAEQVSLAFGLLPSLASVDLAPPGLATAEEQRGEPWPPALPGAPGDARPASSPAVQTPVAGLMRSKGSQRSSGAAEAPAQEERGGAVGAAAAEAGQQGGADEELLSPRGGGFQFAPPASQPSAMSIDLQLVMDNVRGASGAGDDAAGAAAGETSLGGAEEQEQQQQQQGGEADADADDLMPVIEVADPIQGLDDGPREDLLPAPNVGASVAARPPSSTATSDRYSHCPSPADFGRVSDYTGGAATGDEAGAAQEPASQAPGEAPASPSQAAEAGAAAAGAGARKSLTRKITGADSVPGAGLSAQSSLGSFGSAPHQSASGAAPQGSAASPAKQQARPGKPKVPANSKAKQSDAVPQDAESAPLPAPTIKGMPLHNALAMAIKANRQQVLAVHSTAVFLGEDALDAGDR